MVTLGFERSVYTTSETSSVVVCAVVTIPSAGCPSASPFSVNLLFLNCTTGIITRPLYTINFIEKITIDRYVIADVCDYVSVLNTLDFSSCSRQSCAMIHIANDTVLEDVFQCCFAEFQPTAHT